MASHLQTIQNFNNWNLPLRIHRRGSFFSDEGFQDFRRYFELAAQDLFREFDVMKTEDSFKSYRKLRDRHLSGTDRAAKIAEEADKYKIVLDVEGFNDSDLQVKVSGPNEIVVEGRQELSGSGSFSNRSFRRLFSLPGLALIQDATSVLSSDNVLTINIPKKIQEITNESEANLNSANATTTADFKKVENVQESSQKCQQTSSSLIKDAFNSQSSDNDSFWDLQIVPRQSFFNDSFFENVRQNFQQSVDEVMQKMQRRMNSVDVGVLKKVRESKDETNVQAISVTEDSKEHKIVLDVHGFSEADLKVRALSETELVVEGKVEKKTDCTSCSHTFKKTFQLPSSVIIRQATSALSSEGILTIIAPKKLESIDYQIPVKTEAASHLTNIIQQEQSKQSLATGAAPREQTVPIVQDQSQNINVSQMKSENSSVNTTATNHTSNHGSANSQILLDKLERTVKMCDDIDNRTPLASSINETNQVSKIHQKSQDSKPLSKEPLEIIAESEKIVQESANLIKDIESTGKSTTNEHFVPVTLDAGITIPSSTNANLNTQQSTHISTSETNKTSRIIPVSLKGSFYNESIFDDARKTIDNEVKDIFTKYRQSSLVDESVQKVETAQSQNSQESSQVLKSGQTTSTILDDAHNYKIVVDVYGFQESEVKVRLSGINEISVEGNSERNKDGSVSKHSFQRTFQLPENIDLERTTTALSEEGILTVTIPKKNQLLLLNKKSVPFSSQLEKDIKAKEDRRTMVVDSTGIVQETRNETRSQPSVAQNTNQSQISQNNSQTSQTVSQSTQEGKREYIVPLSLEDTSDTVSEAGSVQSTSNLTSQMSTTSNTSKDLSQDILSSSTSCSSINTQVNVPTGSNTDKVIQVQGLNSVGADRTVSTNEQARDIVTRTLFNLPIVSKGYFFDDNFFQDSRSMFESILRNKMNRFNRSTSFVDDIGFFKSLRENKLTSGNQMATLSEDDRYNKIVLDVHGFNENDLKIRVLGENEIHIEGSVEEKTGNSMSRKTFKKHFILPGNVDLRGASSALSSDGVLNIKVPKKA